MGGLPVLLDPVVYFLADIEYHENAESHDEDSGDQKSDFGR
jgi:hypothetical protein